VADAKAYCDHCFLQDQGADEAAVGGSSRQTIATRSAELYELEKGQLVRKLLCR
jgi:hypothetical protein